ncbi:hypothetical protein L1987_26110 [Smallanthus sonchifolius]|uniref:Uncharacterized protein n=1 Tax=Smallanthus sonchifolius TaxID=185202 RepID=A0ACB9I934_9ASTR|nr:hypothetical protein L1987_26110 [Smallanthus sonchifolius]
MHLLHHKLLVNTPSLLLPRIKMDALQIMATEQTTVKITQKTNGAHDDQSTQKSDSYITLTGHRAGEAAFVYEHGADIKALMPKLLHSDYYTEPRIQELAAKERVEPGFCRRVKDFVVGRHNYGSIKFLGETDVRRLDLESLIQFNNREVIVYMDETKKPPVGQGLNKPAESKGNGSLGLAISVGTGSRTRTSDCVVLAACLLRTSVIVV